MSGAASALHRMAADITTSPPPGVPDHELLGRIGAGAYGEVWLARTALGTQRAVKVVRRERFAHPRPFEREFSGIQQYEPLSRQHAALVDVLQVGRAAEAGWFYYVMELADAAPSTEGYVPQTLREMLRARRRLPVSEVAALGVQIAGGLSFLHAHGLVHRDLKPSNIIFVEGAPKLADVGLVAAIGEELSYVGTEGYIAPEGPGSPAADIFALGLVLYEAATGQSRHDFPQLPAALAASEEAHDFAELNAVLLRACAPRASDRFAGAAQLAEELRALAAGRSVRRLRELEATLRRVRKAGAAVAVIALLAASAWFFQKRETEQARELARQEAAQVAALAAKEHELRLNLHAADMSQAGEALRAGNLGRARDLLRAWQPEPGGEDVRGAAWGFLAAAAAGEPHRVWRGHARNVSGLALSADAATAYSCGFDGTLRAWDVATGEGRVLAERKGESFYQMARLADGDFLLGSTTTFFRWRAASGEWQALAQGAARSIAVAADESWAVFGGKTQFFGPDEPIEMVALDGRTTPHRFAEPSGRCAASPDGRWLATGEVKGVAALWDTATWTRAASLECPGQSIALAFSPDSKMLAGALREGGVIFWDIGTGRALAKLEGHARQNVWCLDFSADGRWLATGGSDGTIHFWNVAAHRLERVLRGHEDEVWRVRFAPDGRWLISSGKDETIRHWRLDAAGDAPLPERLARRAIFSADGHWLAVAEKNGPACIFDSHTFAPAGELAGSQVPLAFTNRDAELITTDLAQKLVHWRWRESVVLREVPLENAGAPFEQFALSADGRWFAASLTDGALVVWAADTGRVAHRTARGESPAFSVAFSPDSRWLASEHEDFGLRLRATDDWAVRWSSSHHKMRVANLVFSLDGQRLLSASWDGTGSVHEVATGRATLTFRGHTSSLQDAGFLGADTIVALEGDASLAFWDLRTGRTSGRLPAPIEESNHCLTVAPDARTLVSTRLSGSRPGVWRAAHFLEKAR